jgi:hypothetical protein
MTFPGPTMTSAEFATCASPLAVNGISLRPVYLPDIVHSVSPANSLDFEMV